MAVHSSLRTVTMFNDKDPHSYVSGSLVGLLQSQPTEYSFLIIIILYSSAFISFNPSTCNANHRPLMPKFSFLSIKKCPKRQQLSVLSPLEMRYAENSRSGCSKRDLFGHSPPVHQPLYFLSVSYFLSIRPNNWSSVVLAI